MQKSKPGRPSNIDNRRAEILQKASTCFTMKGYNDTTLDEIGETLGFNKAALYYYFRNKEDLFSHVINYEMKRNWCETVKATDAQNSIENKLIKYFDIRFDVSIGLIKATNLSKLNLISLNDSYYEANDGFKKEQMDYVKSILSKAGTNHTDEELTQFIALLTKVMSSITMSGLLLNGNAIAAVNMDEIKKTRKQVLQHFLNSFAGNKSAAYVAEEGRLPL